MSINRSNYEIYFIDYLDGTLSEADKIALDVFLAENPDLAAELEGDLPVLEPVSASVNLSELLKPLKWDEAEATDLYISKLESEKDGKLLSDSDQHRLAQFEQSFPLECQKLSELINKTVLNPNAISELKERAKLGLLQLETDAPHTELIAYLEGDLSVSEANSLENRMAGDASLATELERLRKTYLKGEKVLLPLGFKEDLKRKAGLIIPLWAKSIAASAAAVAAVVFMINGNDKQVTTAFVPRTSTYVDLSYDDIDLEDEGKEQFIYDENLASTDVPSSSEKEIEGEIDVQHVFPITPYEEASPFLVESPLDERNNKVSPEFLEEDFSEPLVAMTGKFTEITLPSLIDLPEGKLVNSEPIILPVFDFNELPVGDDLAQETKDTDSSLTPYEFLERKVKERLAKDAEGDQGMALAFVNRTAKKLKPSDKDIIAYEKQGESKDGFKFRLGNLFSIERSR